MRRQYGFYIKPSFQAHYNPSIGKYVSSRSEYENDLKVLSEKASLHTGIEHRFTPHDARDHEAFGLTSADAEDGRATFERERPR